MNAYIVIIDAVDTDGRIISRRHHVTSPSVGEVYGRDVPMLLPYVGLTAVNVTVYEESREGRKARRLVSG